MKSSRLNYRWRKMKSGSVSVLCFAVETLLDHPGQLAETTARFLKTIEKHTERLVLLIEDLLTLSQLESGNLSLNLQSTKLRPLVNGVVEDLRHKAQERSLSRMMTRNPFQSLSNPDQGCFSEIRCVPCACFNSTATSCPFAVTRCLP